MTIKPLSSDPNPEDPTSPQPSAGRTGRRPHHPLCNYKREDDMRTDSERDDDGDTEGMLFIDQDTLGRGGIR